MNSKEFNELEKAHEGKAIELAFQQGIAKKLLFVTICLFSISMAGLVAYFTYQNNLIINLYTEKTSESIDSLSQNHERATKFLYNEATKEISNINSRINNLLYIKDDSKLNFQLTDLKKSIELIEERLVKIEEIAIGSPGNILSNQLIKNDIENIKYSVKNDYDKVDKKIADLFTFNLWFWGIMFTMFFSLIGLIITFNKNPKN